MFLFQAKEQNQFLRRTVKFLYHLADIKAVNYIPETRQVYSWGLPKLCCCSPTKSSCFFPDLFCRITGQFVSFQNMLVVLSEASIDGVGTRFYVTLTQDIQCASISIVEVAHSIIQNKHEGW